MKSGQIILVVVGVGGEGMKRLLPSPGSFRISPAPASPSWPGHTALARHFLSWIGDFFSIELLQKTLSI